MRTTPTGTTLILVREGGEIPAPLMPGCKEHGPFTVASDARGAPWSLSCDECGGRWRVSPL